MSTLDKPIASSRVRPVARTSIRTDWLLVGLFIAALLLVTGIPYLYGAFMAPEGRVFQGIAFNVADIAQYWSWMRDHQTGLLVPNRMTPEANNPALFNLLWLILGQIQRLTGLSEAAMYQVLRIGGGASFLIVLWWFLGLFTTDRAIRWTSYAVISLGAGFGWVWVVEKYARNLSDVRFPFDVYVAEPNTFFSLLALPHFLTAGVLLLAIFGCFLLAEERNDDWRGYGLATLWALLLGLSHAYDLLIVYGVLGVFVLLQFGQARRILWGRFWGLAAVGLLSFPPAGYFTLLTTRDPLWREVLSQFDNAGAFTPNLLHLPILLGATLILTAAYGIWLLKNRNQPRPSFVLRRRMFLWVWIIIGFGLLYIPTDFQIHMLNPYHIPLALLSVEAVALWSARKSPNLRRWALLALIAIVLPTNIYLLGWRLIDLRRAERPFYLSTGEQAAIDWLDARSDEHAVVLSDLGLGQYVPALTGHRAYLSHWAQTAHFYDRQADVVRFFDANTTETDRQAILDQFDVEYVIYGTDEQALGSFDPASTSRLMEVFAADDTAIYQVVR